MANKKISTKELRELTRSEVEQKLKQEQESLFNLRLRHGAQQVPSPIELRLSRRAIARIKTVLTEDAAGVRKLAAGAEPKK
jgi:large subunit ribosomal protein L29